MWGGRAGPQNASHKYGVIPSRHSGETEVLLKEFPPDNHSSHTEEVNVKMITPSSGPVVISITAATVLSAIYFPIFFFFFFLIFILLLNLHNCISFAKDKNESVKLPNTLKNL